MLGSLMNPIFLPTSRAPSENLQHSGLQPTPPYNPPGPLINPVRDHLRLPLWQRLNVVPLMLQTSVLTY